MKNVKTHSIILLLLFSVLLVASCTGKSKTSAKRDLKESDYQEMGVGTMVLNTAGGTSENGNVPVVYADKDTIITQIEVDTYEFDGSKLSYIYIDGMLNTKEQLGESQMPIDLEKAALSEGKHKVEVIQYENDDAKGQMLTYKSAEYEIKAK